MVRVLFSFFFSSLSFHDRVRGCTREILRVAVQGMGRTVYMCVCVTNGTAEEVFTGRGCCGDEQRGSRIRFVTVGMPSPPPPPPPLPSTIVFPLFFLSLSLYLLCALALLLFFSLFNPASL